MMCHNQVVQKRKDGRLYLRPCGQCLNCLINDTRSWFVRSHFELKKLERPFHYFLTLTYNDDNIPDDGLCKKEDLKKFLNNLNTSFGLHMRYFATADYGSINNRCHYHAILLCEKKLTQKQCERIWKKGFVYLKPSNTENIKYVLRYTVKKKPFKNGEKGYFRLISKGWGNNVSQYYVDGQDHFVIDGKKYGISRYLRDKLGLDKKVLTYYSYESMIKNCKDYDKKIQNYDNYLKEQVELVNYRRKLK